MFNTPVGYAHLLLSAHVQQGDVVVDATIGNGNDTMLLAKLVGSQGTVYGIDIQQVALDVTAAKLERAGYKAHLVLDNHSRLQQVVPKEYHGQVRAVMFNLGYLPGGDRDVTTLAPSTVDAIHAALNILHPNGMITIVAYQHDEGKREALGIRILLASLSNDNYLSTETTFVNRSDSAPTLFTICKYEEPIVLPER